MGITCQSSTVVPGGDLAQVQQAGCMLSNTTATARPGPVSPTGLTWCLASGHLRTGTWARAWRNGSSLRPEGTWLPWRGIMKRWAQSLWMARMRVRSSRGSWPLQCPASPQFCMSHFTVSLAPHKYSCVSSNVALCGMGFSPGSGPSLTSPVSLSSLEVKSQGGRCLQ